MKLENSASTWIMRTRFLVNSKSEGKIGYIWGPILKPSICFQWSWNFQGIFIDNWSRDRQIYIKIYRAVFLKNAKFVGMHQIIYICAKTVTKGAECKLIKILLTRDRLEQFSSFLYSVFNGIKPLWDEAAFPKLIIFLKN